MTVLASYVWQATFGWQPICWLHCQAAALLACSQEGTVQVVRTNGVRAAQMHFPNQRLHNSSRLFHVCMDFISHDLYVHAVRPTVAAVHACSNSVLHATANALHCTAVSCLYGDTQPDFNLCSLTLHVC